MQSSSLHIKSLNYFRRHWNLTEYLNFKHQSMNGKDHEKDYQVQEKRENIKNFDI